MVYRYIRKKLRLHAWSPKIRTGNDVNSEISAQDPDTLYDAELQKFTTSALNESAPVLPEKAKNDFYDASFEAMLCWRGSFVMGRLWRLFEDGRN